MTAISEMTKYMFSSFTCISLFPSFVVDPSVTRLGCNRHGRTRTRARLLKEHGRHGAQYWQLGWVPHFCALHSLQIPLRFAPRRPSEDDLFRPRIELSLILAFGTESERRVCRRDIIICTTPNTLSHLNCNYFCLRNALSLFCIRNTLSLIYDCK